MTRFVIDPLSALKILEDGTTISPEHEILAPVLLRSQVLDILYDRVRTGELVEEEALSLNARFSKLKFRYLGDAVLRRRAWSIAGSLDMPSTFDAEYIALTQLQADALVASSKTLAKLAKSFVDVQPFYALKNQAT